jgi:hypothetical protein
VRSRPTRVALPKPSWRVLGAIPIVLGSEQLLFQLFGVGGPLGDHLLKNGEGE